MKQINRILKDGGKLFARVNTINETEAGAGDGEEIEPNFYKNPLRGINKRFFQKKMFINTFLWLEPLLLKKYLLFVMANLSLVLKLFAQNKPNNLWKNKNGKISVFIF